MGRIDKSSLKGENLKRNVESISFWIFIIILLVIVFLSAMGITNIFMIIGLGVFMAFYILGLYAWEQKFINMLNEEHKESVVIKTYVEIQNGGQSIRLIGTSPSEHNKVSASENSLIDKIIENIEKNDLDYETKIRG